MSLLRFPATEYYFNFIPILVSIVNYINQDKFICIFMTFQLIISLTIIIFIYIFTINSTSSALNRYKSTYISIMTVTNIFILS